MPTMAHSTLADPARVDPGAQIRGAGDKTPAGRCEVGAGWNAVNAAALLAAGLAPRSLRRVLAAFEGLDAYLAAGDSDLAAVGVSRVAPAAWKTPADGFVVMMGRPAYPALWASCPTAPPVLVGLGDVAALDPAGSVAVVGARAMTAMGQAAARAAVAGAARCDAVVVSGMAAGVDTAAHDAALEEELMTVGVAGASLDALDHDTSAVAERILAGGGAVVSHLMAPGTRRTAPHLHARNHVIAHLAGVVVPCEGRLRSGTASAVRAAVAAGDTLVVPFPRRGHRNAPNVELLMALCHPSPALAQLGINGDLAAAVAGRRPLADAVADDREGLAVLVDAAVRFRAAGGFRV
jgi:hypothetical protein